MFQQHPNSCHRHTMTLSKENRVLNLEALEGLFRKRWVAFPCAPTVPACSEQWEQQWLSYQARECEAKLCPGTLGRSFPELHWPWLWRPGNTAPAILLSVLWSWPGNKDKLRVLTTMLVMFHRLQRTDSLILRAQTNPQPRAA